MLGVTAAGESKAFPVKSILTARLIQDRLGNIRCCSSSDRITRPYALSRPATAPSLWSSFPHLTPLCQTPEPSCGMPRPEATGTSKAVPSTALAGHCLEPVDSFKDYWFDWMNHHPATKVFRS